MGKLSTQLGLPPKILLQGWGGNQENNDINGEYIYQIFNAYYSPRGYAYVNPGKGTISFYNTYWTHYSEDEGWYHPSTNPNVLPLTGWIQNNAVGSAGTITPILTNTKNISIKKQNLGAGKLTSN